MYFFKAELTFPPIFGKRDFIKNGRNHAGSQERAQEWHSYRISRWLGTPIALNIRQAFSETVGNELVLDLVGGVPQGTDPFISSIIEQLQHPTILFPEIVFPLKQPLDGELGPRTVFCWLERQLSAFFRPFRTSIKPEKNPCKSLVIEGFSSYSILPMLVFRLSLAFGALVFACESVLKHFFIFV